MSWHKMCLKNCNFYLVESAHVSKCYGERIFQFHKSKNYFEPFESKCIWTHGRPNRTMELAIFVDVTEVSRCKLIVFFLAFNIDNCFERKRRHHRYEPVVTCRDMPLLWYWFWPRCVVVTFVVILVSAKTMDPISSVNQMPVYASAW